MSDRHDAHEENIALLIDADNASPEHLDEVLLVLGELGAINVRRAYGNWAKSSLKGWGNLTGIHSIVPMQQFDVAKGKSATDMRMTIDAMDLLYRGHCDGFGIMSSDSDFLPLAQRIREEGLPVIAEIRRSVAEGEGRADIIDGEAGNDGERACDRGDRRSLYTQVTHGAFARRHLAVEARDHPARDTRQVRERPLGIAGDEQCGSNGHESDRARDGQAQIEESGEPAVEAKRCGPGHR